MNRLTRRTKWIYSLGQLGWSILSGIIQVWLVWFYNPPKNVDLPLQIPQGPILGVLTIIGLITMSGRFLDSITDPLIASWSDKSDHPKGRRLPLMQRAAIPFALLTFLVFFSPFAQQTITVIWLVITLLSYYVFYTMYVAPYFALTAELGYTSQDRIDLSTYIAFTWFFGYIIASAAAYIWPLFESVGFSLVSAIRLTFGILSFIGLILMFIPVWALKERPVKRSVAPGEINFMTSVKLCFKNRNFLIFEIFFLAYGIALTIFQTGNVYYATVLMGLEETSVSLLTAVTGILAFSLYPAVNHLSKKFGKKALCSFAMIMLVIAYGYCGFLGMYPFSVYIQGGIFILFAGIGIAIFGILPNAICADIAFKDGESTGNPREGMFFAVQTFMFKMGQMIAMLLFSSLLLLGKDVGDDLGIRLTGIMAAVIGVGALVIFHWFDDE